MRLAEAKTFEAGGVVVLAGVRRLAVAREARSFRRTDSSVGPALLRI
jgi:hypothetical protein